MRHFHSQVCFLIGSNSVYTEIHYQITYFGDGDFTVGFECLVALGHKFREVGELTSVHDYPHFKEKKSCIGGELMYTYFHVRLDLHNSNQKTRKLNLLRCHDEYNSVMIKTPLNYMARNL